MEKIKLVISLPDGVFKEAIVDTVQIPTIEGELTILDQHAPTVFVLKIGMIQILDNNFKPLERFYIRGGTAEYVNKECKILVESIEPFDAYTAIEAFNLSETSLNDSDKEYYGMIFEAQSIYGEK